jgi:hypothetical protein
MIHNDVMNIISYCNAPITCYIGKYNNTILYQVTQNQVTQYYIILCYTIHIVSRIVRNKQQHPFDLIQ